MIYNKSGSKDEFFIYRDAICKEGGDIMATKVGQKYECRECGLIIKVVEEGAGMLYCCDEPMKVEKPKTSADFMQATGGDFKGRALQ